MATKKQTTNSEALSLDKLRAEYTKLRLEIKGGKLKNSNAHKALRKQIAQSLTKTK